ncbi:MAG: hypothetical protein O3A46_01865 [Candidatus Poribacteria bacterium]|nr:hypothetical protein [Candidatus Poribacteria bacterium]
MELTVKQKKQFHDDGYVVIPGAIPQIMVDAAMQVINHSLGTEGMNKEDLPTLRSQSYCKEARSHSAITDLFNVSPVRSLLESMLGEGNVNHAGGGQIGLRFPGPVYADAREPRGHLDGLGSGLNGMEKGVYSRGFTGLAVCYLNDVPKPYSGNFTVWPKSHRAFQDYFIEHGHEVLANGMPQIDLPEPPVMITGKPGDVVIAHHQIVHCAAPNSSPNIRYGVIFRIRHKDCGEVGLDAYKDIWREWPGIRAVMEEQQAAAG